MGFNQSERRSNKIYWDTHAHTMDQKLSTHSLQHYYVAVGTAIAKLVSSRTQRAFVGGALQLYAFHETYHSQCVATHPRRTP